MKLYYRSIIVIIVLFNLCAYSKVNVVFRYDDFSGDYPEKRDSDPLRKKIWEKEKEMDTLFRKYNMPYNLAIIPERKADDDFIPFGVDYEKIDFVKKGIQEKRMEVSQHGFRHSNHVKSGHRASEFSNRTYQEQYEDILKGKIILEAALDETVDIFVAPYNGWSYPTGQVLEKCNFSIFSADRYYCYNSISAMSVIPFTALIAEIETLDLSVIKSDAAIIILFHPEEIVRSDSKRGEYGEIQYISMERLENLLKKFKENDNIHVVTMKELLDMGDFSFQKYQAVAKQYSFYYFFSPVINFRTKTAKLVSVPLFEYATTSCYGLTIAAIVIAIVLIGFIVGVLLCRIFDSKQKRWVFLLIFIVTLMVLAKVFHVYYKGFTLLTIKHVTPILLGAGSILGFIFHSMRFNRRYG